MASRVRCRSAPQPVPCGSVGGQARLTWAAGEPVSPEREPRSPVVTGRLASGSRHPAPPAASCLQKSRLCAGALLAGVWPTSLKLLIQSRPFSHLCPLALLTWATWKSSEKPRATELSCSPTPSLGSVGVALATALLRIRRAPGNFSRESPGQIPRAFVTPVQCCDAPALAGHSQGLRKGAARPWGHLCQEDSQRTGGSLG